MSMFAANVNMKLDFFFVQTLLLHYIMCIVWQAQIAK